MNHLARLRTRRKSSVASSTADQILAQNFPAVATNKDRELELLADQLLEGGIWPILELILECQQRLGSGAWLRDRLRTLATVDPLQLRALTVDQLPQQRAAHRVRAAGGAQ